MCTVNVENFTEMVRNCAGKRDLIVSASMECVRCREVLLPGGILTVVAVKAIENGSWVVSSAV